MHTSSKNSPELACFSSTHSHLLYCFLPPVLSLFLLPQVRPSLCSLLPIPTPSFSQGDLNKSACREFPFYIYNNVSCTALLCSSGTASEHILQILWQGCHCHLPQGFASVKFVLIPRTFTHSAADLIIAGLHCSKLGNFRLPFLGLFNLRLACNEGIIWKVCLFGKQLCGGCLVRCAQPSVKLAILSADSNIAAAMWSSEPQITSQAVRAF